MSLRDANPVNSRRPKRVAIVIANPAVSTTSGWPVGFWWSELAHPYLEFHERGYEVEIFSPDGGRCEADAMSDPRDPSGYSASDLISMGFIATPALAALVERTKPVAELPVDAFDAIVVAGGQAPMFAFEQARALQRAFVEFYERGKVAAALCHGTALLRYATLADGTPLVRGKTVTGFANVEEDFADRAVWDMGALPRDTRLMPWRIEDELKKLGANYVQAGLWRSFAIRDGNLVTGQQNFSGAETARGRRRAGRVTVRVAVIGAANVGGTLGRRWAELGHEVVFGLRRPERGAAGVKGGDGLPAGASVAPPEEAVHRAYAVLLATPWSAVPDALRALGDRALGGVPLLDATNPLGPGLALDATLGGGSGAERVQAMAPRAHVVKVFNTTGYDNMRDPSYDGAPTVMFHAGGDAGAKAVARALSSALGFDAVDAGPLARARELEHLAVLWISLAYGGLGRDIAFRLVRRSRSTTATGGS